MLKAPFFNFKLRSRWFGSLAWITPQVYLSPWLLSRRPSHFILYQWGKVECQCSHMSERYTYLSQIKLDKWCVVTTPIARIIDQVLWCILRTAKHVFCWVTSSGVMTTANTNAIFGCRDAGWDILKIIPLVRLVLKSFMDAIYQSYVKLHGVIFYVEN